jgi:hypothetical protein
MGRWSYPLHCTKAHLSTTLTTGREVLLLVRKRGAERIEVFGTGLENIVGAQVRNVIITDLNTIII